MAKVAIVLNASWNIWNFRLPLLQYLSDQGHEIVVIAPEDEYSSRIPWEYHHVKMMSRSTNPFTDYLIYRNLKRLFKKTQPDVVLLYTIKPNVYGNFAARQLGIPTISNIAGLGNLFIHSSPVTYVARMLYRMALKHPGCVFFQNGDDCKQFTDEGLVKALQTQILPGSGIDLDRFIPSNEVQHFDNTRPFVFLLLSRMLWDKGVAEYAAAAKALLEQRVSSEFQLLGVVDADNPQAVTQQDMDGLVKESGVVYLGISDSVEINIEKADCIVLPSYREGLPRSLLEAAAMAKPIIATDVPGCRDVVEDGVTGYLCSPRDAEDLQQKMYEMIKLDAGERQLMGQRGREKMQREFDQRFVFEKYEKAIKEALLF